MNTNAFGTASSGIVVTTSVKREETRTIDLSNRSALAILFLLCLVLFWRILVCGSEYVVGGLDIINNFYNYKFFIKEAYLSGHLALWNPYYFGGHPFASNSVAAAFYPPDFIFLFLPIPRAINISYFIHIFLAGVFMFYWIKRFNVRNIACLTGSIVFMFCGFIISRLPGGHFSMIRTAVYVPLIFCMYECGVRSERKRWIIFGGFAMGMQLLAGHPQIAYYTILFLGIYGLCRFASDSTGKKTRSVRRFAIPLIGMIFIGVMTAAVSLFPMFELFMSTQRSGGGYEYVPNRGFNPLRLMHLFFPNIPLSWSGVVNLPVNLEFNPYIGILPLFLVMFSLTSARKKQSYIFGFLALSALLLAFGSYTPLFRIFYIMPGIRSFRLHSRVLLLFMFFCATLAGTGAEALIERYERGDLSGRKTMPLAWSLLLLAIILILLLNFEILFKLVYGQMNPLDEALILPLVLMSVTTVFVWIIYLKKIPLRWLNICLVSIVAGDLILTGWKHVTTQNVVECYRMPSSFLAGRLEKLPLGHYRVFLHESVLPANHGMYYHIENLNGFYPLFLERTARFMEEMTEVRPFRDPDDYMIDIKNFLAGSPFPFRILNVRYSMFFDIDSATPMLVENKDPFPRVLWTPHAEVVPDQEEIIKRLRSDDFDPRLTILLEQAPSRPLSTITADVPAASVQITDYQINSMEVVFIADTDGWLLFSEQFYPGWKAWCDAKPVPIYRADYILRAIPVPAGKHRVVMRYCPFSFKLGAALSLLSLLAFLGMLLRSVFFRGSTE